MNLAEFYNPASSKVFGAPQGLRKRLERALVEIGFKCLSGQA
jgi:hypothetical protein